MGVFSIMILPLMITRGCVTMDQQTMGMQTEPKKLLGKTIQVRLVSDLKQSQLYYRDRLGCQVDDWGQQLYN